MDGQANYNLPLVEAKKMNLLGNYLEKSTAATHSIYPAPTKARFLLPLSAEGRKVGLSFFVDGLLRRVWLKMSALGKDRPQCKFSEEFCNATGIEKEELPYIVIKHGTPSPYTKHAILQCTNKWQPQYVSKFATTPNAARLLKNEVTTLQDIGQFERLRDFTPRVLHVASKATTYCFRETLTLGKPWQKNDIAPAIELLKMLQSETRVRQRLVDSRIYENLTRRFFLLKNRFPGGWVARAERALDCINQHGDEELVFARTHGDYAYWNIKKINGNPFVYDWEFSEPGYPTLYDVFHYVMMPAVCHGASSAKIAQRAMEIGDAFSGGLIGPSEIQLQIVLYLLDICLLYLESHASVSNGDIVVKEYGRLLDQLTTQSAKSKISGQHLGHQPL